MRTDIQCSTRYQVVTAFDRQFHLDSQLREFGTEMPRELLFIIASYMTFTRGEELRGDRAYITRRWNELKKNNAQFYQLAFLTEIFQYATHGYECFLSPHISLNFAFVEGLIPQLYPTTFRDDSEELEISPLDLPRLPNVDISNSDFHPYHPFNWGQAQSDPNGAAADSVSLDSPQKFWDLNDDDLFIQPRGQYLSCPTYDEEDETMALMPLQRGGTFFCSLLIKANYNQFFLDKREYETTQHSTCLFLPIANAAVNRSTETTITERALYIDSNLTQFEFGFTYYWTAQG